MAKQKIETVRELIYWSYANLAMAHSAVDKGNEKYGMLNFMIRAYSLIHNTQIQTMITICS